MPTPFSFVAYSPWVYRDSQLNAEHLVNCWKSTSIDCGEFCLFVSLFVCFKESMLELLPGSAACVWPHGRNSSYLHNFTSGIYHEWSPHHALCFQLPFCFQQWQAFISLENASISNWDCPTSSSAYVWDCQSLSISYSSAFAFSCISWGISSSFQWLSGFLICFMLFFLCCLLGTNVETPLPPFFHCSSCYFCSLVPSLKVIQEGSTLTLPHNHLAGGTKIMKYTTNRPATNLCFIQNDTQM